jgi:hypothetical protein
VEKLCAHRWVETGFEFLVQWEPTRNGTPWEDSWEPEKNIHHELIESYFDGIALREKRMVVGVPMCFKVSLSRGTDLASTSLEFCTNHGNGMFGTLTHPPMVCGMMREVRHFNRVLAYAKAHLPATHPLAKKGWKRLPSGVHTLAASVAVPVEPQPQQSRS